MFRFGQSCLGFDNLVKVFDNIVRVWTILFSFGQSGLGFDNIIWLDKLVQV